MAIFRKQVLKQALKEVKRKIKIMIIFNRYKDTLENLIYSSNIKLLDMPRLVDKGARIVMSSFKDLSTEFELDKNLLDRP